MNNEDTIMSIADSILFSEITHNVVSDGEYVFNTFEEKYAIPVKVELTEGGPTAEPTFWIYQGDSMVVLSKKMLEAILNHSVVDPDYNSDYDYDYDYGAYDCAG